MDLSSSIQYLCSVLLVWSSFVSIFSMIMMVRSSMECPGRLKCAETGFCVLLCLISDLRWVRCLCKAFFVFVQGILCLAHVLWAPFTPPAFNQIDYVLSLAGGKCAHWVGLACSSAFETVSDLDVFTSLTVTAVAWSVSTCDGDSIDSIHDSC